MRNSVSIDLQFVDDVGALGNRSLEVVQLLQLVPPVRLRIVQMSILLLVLACHEHSAAGEVQILQVP